MKKPTRMIAMLLAVCLLLCACGAQTPNEKEGAGLETTQDIDPADDGVLNILMIGNSFCYYYVEELVGLAAADGIKMRVCNVYYSGCKLSQHYNW